MRNIRALHQENQELKKRVEELRAEHEGNRRMLNSIQQELSNLKMQLQSFVKMAAYRGSTS